MSNLALKLRLTNLSIPFARSKVGDRYVMELLNEKQWSIGGEGSGHVLCLDVQQLGDGIVAGLQVLSAMIRTQLSLAEFDFRNDKISTNILINVRFNRRFISVGE